MIWHRSSIRALPYFLVSIPSASFAAAAPSSQADSEITDSLGGTNTSDPTPTTSSQSSSNEINDAVGCFQGILSDTQNSLGLPGCFPESIQDFQCWCYPQFRSAVSRAFAQNCSQNHGGVPDNINGPANYQASCSRFFASLNETAKTEETSSAPSPSISIIVKDSADEPFTADEIIFLVFIFGIVPIAVSITICWAYGKFRRRRRRKAREKKQEMLNDRLGLTFKDAQYTTSTTIVAPYTLSRKDEYDSSESEDEEDRAPLIAPSQTLRIDTQSQPTNSDNALLPTPYTLYSVSSTVVGRPSITLAPTPVRPALQLETDNDTRFQSVTPGVELNPHTPIAQFLEPRDVVLSPYVQPSPDPNSTQVSEKVKERRSYLLRQLEAARTQFDQLSRRASTLPSGTINIEAIAPSSESNLESWQPTSNAPFVTLSSPIDINFLAATVALPGTEDASNLNDQQQHRLQQQYAQGGQPLNQDDTYLLPQAPPGQASGGVDPQIQAYLDQLSNTISRLNELVQSSYALGQSDDPPPGYFD